MVKHDEGVVPRVASQRDPGLDLVPRSRNGEPGGLLEQLRRHALRGAVCVLSASALVLAQAPGALRAQAPDVAQGAGAPLKPQGTAKFTMKAGVPVNQPAVEKAALSKQVRAMRIQNLEPLIQQYEQQGRPVSRGELFFARKVCGVSRDQLKAMVKETDSTLKEVAKTIVEGQQNVGARTVARGQSVQTPDAATLLRQRLAAAFKKHLSPEQQARYDEEVEKRTAGRKRAGVNYLVDALDRELLLSASQRDKIASSLRANWDDSWFMYIEYITYGNQFFPQAIDRFVAPVLDATQKKAWQTTQKVQGFWGFGGIWNMQNDDSVLNELLGEKAQPVPKNAAFRKFGVRKVELEEAAPENR
jgi:hypothetical protein